MEKIKKYLLIVSIIFLVEGVVLFFMTEPKQLSPNHKIQIITTFYPLTEFAQEIGKDRVEVITLINSEDELHGFDLTLKDRLRIEKADLIIYNGAGMEPWLDKILPHLDNKIKIINSSIGLELLESTSDDDHKDTIDRIDPHFLLDPSFAISVVDKISDTLAIIDYNNAKFYQDNSKIYKDKLHILVDQFNKNLVNCKKGLAITPHISLTYLAKKYNFKEVAISGAHEEDSSAFMLKRVIDIARTNNIKYVFLDRSVDGDVLTIINEIKAQALILISDLILNKEELSQGKNYINVMENNLDNLKTGMECGV